MSEISPTIVIYILDDRVCNGGGKKHLHTNTYVHTLDKRSGNTIICSTKQVWKWLGYEARTYF